MSRNDVELVECMWADLLGVVGAGMRNSLPRNPDDWGGSTSRRMQNDDKPRSACQPKGRCSRRNGSRPGLCVSVTQQNNRENI